MTHEHILARQGDQIGLLLRAVDMDLRRSPRQRAAPRGGVLPIAHATSPIERRARPQGRRPNYDDEHDGRTCHGLERRWSCSADPIATTVQPKNHPVLA